MRRIGLNGIVVCAVRGHPGRRCVPGRVSRLRGFPGSLLRFIASGVAVPSRLAAAFALLAAGVAADVASTYVAIDGGQYVEGSPVGGAFIAAFGLVPGMLLTKAAGMVVIGVPVAVAGGTRRLVATLMFAGVGLLSLATAARNLLLFLGLWP